VDSEENRPMTESQYWSLEQKIAALGSRLHNDDAKRINTLLFHSYYRLISIFTSLKNLKITRTNKIKNYTQSGQKKTSTSKQTDDVFQIYVAGCLYTHKRTLCGKVNSGDVVEGMVSHFFDNISWIFSDS
jgi:hypothetical protein